MLATSTAVCGKRGGVIQLKIDFKAAVKEYEDKEINGEIMSVLVPCSTKTGIVDLKIIALYSDNHKMAVVALSRYPSNANFVVIQNSKGHTAIFSRGRPKLNEAIKILRIEEQKSGGKIIADDWNKLSAGGTIAGIEEWYYDIYNNAIFNGCRSHPEIPPTKLSLQKVLAAVYIGLDKKAFPKVCEKENVCKGKSCSYFPWGLKRCRTYRFNSKHKD